MSPETNQQGVAPTQETTTAGAPEPRVDLIDTVVLTTAAAGVDLLGIIPVVGEVMTPMGIFAFRGLFWLKGMNSGFMNTFSAATGGTELVPMVSEVLPGCTAFVLTTCLLERYSGKIGEVSGALAAAGPEAISKTVGAVGVAAAANQQGSSMVAAASKGVAAAGGAGGATGAAMGTQTATGTSAGAQFKQKLAASRGAAAGGFNNQGELEEESADTEESSRNQKGAMNQNALGADNAYAPGSPLVEGQPQAVPGTGKVISFAQKRREQQERKRKAA